MDENQVLELVEFYEDMIEKQDEIIEEIVGEAVGRIRKRFPDSVVNVSVPEEMLIVPMDATLIEQVLINLMENHIFIPKHFLLLDTRRLCLAEQSDP